MRDPARIDPLLKELGELWKLFPDMRFGQLVQNIPSLAGYHDLGGGDWHFEEDQWTEMIHRAKRAGRALQAADEYMATQADTEERYASSEEG